MNSAFEPELKPSATFDITETHALQIWSLKPKSLENLSLLTTS